MSNAGVPQASSGRVLSGVQRAYPLVAAGLAAWMLVWIWLSWPYSLDDALIHLRYADHLLHLHRVTYDGVHPSFGTSSLLYVSLLAALRSLWTSPLLPRVLSSITYLCLFSGLAVTLWRGLPQSTRGARSIWWIALALLMVMVEPSAARWLNDGMETGLVFVAALLAIVLLRRVLAIERPGAPLVLGAVAYGFFVVLLRVELLLLVGSVSLMAGLELLRLQKKPTAGAFARRRMLTALMPLLGGMAAALLVVVTMHALLPDTALAKAFGASAWGETIQMSAITIASSFSFGIGLLLLWLCSLMALTDMQHVRPADLCANLLFPVVLLLSAARGQQIQGIRYFGWTLFFPLLWNLLRFNEASPRKFPGTDSLLRSAVVLLVVLLVASSVWESRTFYRLFQGRGSALTQMRAEHLESLQGQLGIAEDVGFVGYFTRGNICDPYGLVNGRDAARLRYQQRFDHCLAMHPAFAFGGKEFLRRVQGEQSLADWSVCGSYRFDNVRTEDVHFLVVSPGEAAKVCPGRAKPVASLLPDLF